MNKAFLAAFAFVLVSAMLSGCLGSSGNTKQVRIFVHEKDGSPVKSARVYAYDKYSFAGNDNSPMKWLSLKDQEIVSTTDTDDTGKATMNLALGKYAFFAQATNGEYGGTEQFIAGDGEQVEVTVSMVLDS